MSEQPPKKMSVAGIEARREELLKKKVAAEAKKATAAASNTELLKQKEEVEKKLEKLGATISDVSEAEYNEFIDNGKVSDARLEALAVKVRGSEKLSPKETAIFMAQTSAIESIIKNKWPVVSDDETTHPKDIDKKKEEQEQWVKDVLESKFGFTQTELPEEFTKLTPGEQKLALENLEQIKYRKVKTEAKEMHQERLAKKSIIGKIWAGMGGDTKIKNYEKDVLREVEADPSILKNELKEIVKNLKRIGVETGFDSDGDSIILFEKGDGASPEMKEALEMFNHSATYFSKIPKEWSYHEGTKWSGEKKRYEQFEEAKRLYEERRETVKELKEQELRTAGKKEHEIVNELQTMLESADGKIRFLQYLNANPDAEKELQNIEDRSKIGQTIKGWAGKGAIFGIIAGSRIGAKYGVTTLTGMGKFITGPAVAAVYGGIRGWFSASKSLREKEALARAGKFDARISDKQKNRLSKEKLDKKITAEKLKAGNFVNLEDGNGRGELYKLNKLIDEADPAKKVYLEEHAREELAKAEEELARTPTEERRTQLQAHIRRLKEKLPERRSELTAEKEAKKKELVAKIDGLKAKLLNIKGKKERAEMEKQIVALEQLLNRPDKTYEESLQESLRVRISYLKEKMDAGLINFGKDQLGNQAELMAALNRAAQIVIFEEPAMQTEIGQRLRTIMGINSEKASSAQLNYKVKRTAIAAVMGATISEIAIVGMEEWHNLGLTEKIGDYFGHPFDTIGDKLGHPIDKVGNLINSVKEALSDEDADTTATELKNTLQTGLHIDSTGKVVPIEDSAALKGTNTLDTNRIAPIDTSLKTSGIPAAPDSTIQDTTVGKTLNTPSSVDTSGAPVDTTAKGGAPLSQDATATAVKEAAASAEPESNSNLSTNEVENAAAKATFSHEGLGRTIEIFRKSPEFQNLSPEMKEFFKGNPMKVAEKLHGWIPDAEDGKTSLTVGPNSEFGVTEDGKIFVTDTHTNEIHTLAYTENGEIKIGDDDTLKYIKPKVGTSASSVEKPAVSPQDQSYDDKLQETHADKTIGKSMPSDLADKVATLQTQTPTPQASGYDDAVQETHIGHATKIPPEDLFKPEGDASDVTPGPTDAEKAAAGIPKNEQTPVVENKVAPKTPATTTTTQTEAKPVEPVNEKSTATQTVETAEIPDAKTQTTRVLDKIFDLDSDPGNEAVMEKVFGQIKTNPVWEVFYATREDLPKFADGSPEIQLWQYINELREVSGLEPINNDETIENYMSRAGKYIIENKKMTLLEVLEKSKTFTR